MAWKKNMSAADKAAYREEKQKEVAKLADMVSAGTQKYVQSDQYKTLLKTMAMFPTYSARNTLLILEQMPQAEMVAGFNTWKALGRHVKKGETGIRILAPVVVNKRKDAEPAKETQSKEGKEGKDDKVVAGFRAVSVFDISQTEGKPVPDYIPPEVMGGTVEGFAALKEALVASTDCAVSYGKLDVGVHGLCHTSQKSIVLQEGMSEEMQIRTLIHEIGHSMMHRGGTGLPKEIRETQAESMAFIAAAHFNLDTSEYTFPYLASWSADKMQELPELWAKIMEPVQQAAGVLIAKVEQNLDQILSREMSQPALEKGSGSRTPKEPKEQKQERATASLSMAAER